jgi:hypothetical protein
LGVRVRGEGDWVEGRLIIAAGILNRRVRSIASDVTGIRE